VAKRVIAKRAVAKRDVANGRPVTSGIADAARPKVAIGRITPRPRSRMFGLSIRGPPGTANNPKKWRRESSHAARAAAAGNAGLQRIPLHGENLTPRPGSWASSRLFR